jgi:predicted phosphodiesterase
MPTGLICGDPHGSFLHIVDFAKANHPDVIFLLGDMDLARPLNVELEDILNSTQIYWIHGNHDTDSEASYKNLFGSSLAKNNLHGRVVTVFGLRVAGLGGVFRKRIWDGVREEYDSPEQYCRTCGKGNLWGGGLPLKHRSSIFPSDIRQFASMSADLLLTHEAPDMHRYGNAQVTQLAKNLGVRSAFHGHHHEEIDYQNGIWFGVGLRGLREIRW